MSIGERANRYLTGYQGPNHPRLRRAIVRSIFSVVVLVAAISSYLWTRQRWYDYDETIFIPGVLLAIAIIAVGVWVWHTLDIKESAGPDDVVIRPYAMGWFIWHFLRQILFVFWPVRWLMRKFEIGPIRLLLALGIVALISVWLGIHQAIWAFFEVSWLAVLVLFFAWSIPYWFVRTIQYLDTYVVIDSDGGVHTYVSTFFITPFHLWRDKMKKSINWGEIDETEEHFWHIPPWLPFAPRTKISFKTERGFQVTLWCLAEHDYRRISRISGERKRQSKVQGDARSRVELDAEVARLKANQP